jgi:hypothetical protein
LKLDFSDETVGAEPKSFVSVVGVWRIESDGRRWYRRQGARALRGPLRRIPRSRPGLCVFPLCGGQGCDGFSRRRDLRAL